MSTVPDFEIDLDLHLLPAWAQQSPEVNRFAHYRGEDAPGERGGDSRHRDRDRAPARRRDQPDRPRPRQDGRPGGPGRPGGSSGPRRPESRDRRGRDFRGQRDERPERQERPEPLPAITASLHPEPKGVETLARQIKLTGRAYPLFEIGGLFMKRPERYQVHLQVQKDKDGKVIQPLYLCNIDQTLFLSETDLAAHVLKRHFATFYQAERTPTDPPKGTYTFVAQCGMSGVILGPPNFHDYQLKLRKLHSERFSRMPFEVFKSRIKIVRDEEVVKKWVEEQSFKTEYVCLNLPEPKKLQTMDEVEAHFREVHLPNILSTVETFTVGGENLRQLMSPGLQALSRRTVDEQRRFPIKLVTNLSHQFASHALQFFKVNKQFTHVSVSRPHYLDMEATPVSDDIKKIVEFINAHPGCTRRKLLDHLAPASAPVPAAKLATPEPVPPSADGAGTSTPAATVAETGPEKKKERNSEDKLLQQAAPTPEQQLVIGNLHWLVHQGHVIEFSNGIMETAKKPLPKPPPKAAPKSPSPEKVAPATSGAAANENPPATESTGSPAAIETATGPESTDIPTPQSLEAESQVISNSAETPADRPSDKPTEAPSGI